jgi:hypothetical protein
MTIIASVSAGSTMRAAMEGRDLRAVANAHKVGTINFRNQEFCTDNSIPTIPTG